MVASKSLDVRDNFKSYCDQVFGGETLIISRPKNENVVMISEKKYNNFQQAINNMEYLKMLNDSIGQIEKGNIVINNIAELRQYE